VFFLPYRIDRQFGIPWLTLGLIALNVAAYVPTFVIGTPIYQAFGFTPDVSGVYTWLTSMFVHGDPLHLIGNMYFLWLFGSVVEDAVGPLRYTLLYFAGGLLAALTNATVTLTVAPQWADVPMVGASGALAAIIGVFAVRLYHHKVTIGYMILFFIWGKFTLPSLVAVGLWFVQQIYYALPTLVGQFTGVASWAHIGGLVFGALFALLFGLGGEADTENLIRKATTQSLSGDHAAAIDSYRQLAAEHPDDPAYRLARVREQWSAGRTDRQSAALEVARAIRMLLGDGKRVDAAEAYVTFSSLGVEPTFDRVTVAALASGAEKGGMLGQAASMYYGLATSHPTTTEGERALFRLAHVYLTMGRPDLARQSWASFVATYPDSEWLAWADARLGE
jgi:membrane associated rhomboid family serine protease